ncbi:MAG: hypothetical protein V4808_00530 [Pseudomonadota bacterium]
MSAIDPAALAEWQSAIGRTEERTERLEIESLRRFALAVDADPAVETVAPPLPHWAFFLPRPADAEIGEDGHPRRGGFLPAIALPRRMFAAADIRFEAPLEIGEEAVLVSTVADLVHKSGRSGDLVFAEVDRVLSQLGQVRIRERQSYVYRDAGGETPLPIAAAERPAGERWMPDAVSLFRFSAATFNSHRIHYDLAYAQSEEGYPALVVHGPFTAARLAGLAANGGKLRRFAFRAQSPLFLGQPIFLQRAANEVRALRCDGAVAMTATFEHE